MTLTWNEKHWPSGLYDNSTENNETSTPSLKTLSEQNIITTPVLTLTSFPTQLYHTPGRQLPTCSWYASWDVWWADAAEDQGASRHELSLIVAALVHPRPTPCQAWRSPQSCPHAYQSLKPNLKVPCTYVFTISPRNTHFGYSIKIYFVLYFRFVSNDLKATVGKS